HRVFRGVLAQQRHLRRVARLRFAHAGVDDMARIGERPRGERPETAGCAGDHDDLMHGMPPSKEWDAHHGRGACMVQMIPPLARSTWPLTQPPSFPARNATTSAISPGWPRRSNGASLARRSISSGDLPLRNSSVAVGPGATALTVMLRPRSSFASTLVIASTAALVAA